MIIYDKFPTHSDIYHMLGLRKLVDHQRALLLHLSLVAPWVNRTLFLLHIPCHHHVPLLLSPLQIRALLHSVLQNEYHI